VANINVNQIVARLEELGVEQVRLLMQTGGLPPLWNTTIVEWLSKKDQDEKRRVSASEEEQLKIARAASDAASRAAAAAERASVAAERQAVAAERANRRATIAIVIAIISIIATVIGMAITHFDSMRSAHP